MQGAQRGGFSVLQPADVTLALSFACKAEFIEEVLRALHLYVPDLIINT